MLVQGRATHRQESQDLVQDIHASVISLTREDFNTMFF